MRKSHHRTSICLVSSLYFLLKTTTTKRWGKKPLKRTKRKKTQHKTDDGFSFIFLFFFFFFSFFLFSFFFSVFFAIGKKMGCLQHRGFLSLRISHCPQPSGSQMPPRHGAPHARCHGRAPASTDTGREGLTPCWRCRWSSCAIKRWPEEPGEGGKRCGWSG